jgi:FKBP-type peptidyl-prolyl cis-trans isomerase 2
LAVQRPPGRSASGAQPGDVVTLSYASAVDDPGFSSDALSAAEEPLTFEVGASSVMGNPLFQAFDQAVRGLCVGESARVAARGGEYDKELLFQVPRAHAEVQRLAADGELREGSVVQLANGQAAVLRRVTDEAVRFLGRGFFRGPHPFFAAGAD